MNIDITKPVMVTGATGYVAGRLVERLLEEGLTVHAPVRSPENIDKLKYLNAIAENTKGSIKYFKADLLKEGSYLEAMQGCTIVFHTASPFSLDIKDPQKELVDPALNGTRNVLETANKVDSVERVVLTSSCAAIYGDSIDVRNMPNKELSEEVWNTSSSLKHQAYSYSKTVAEKEAWKIAEAQTRWKMVVLNPSFVMGPGINPYGTSETFKVMKQMSDGTMKVGAPEMEIGVVDVRDLAEAHFRAGFKANASGRNIISGTDSSFIEMGKILKAEHPKYPFPASKLPKFLIWLIAPAVGMTREMVSKNVGYAWSANNSKSIKELGMNYRPLKETLSDFFIQLLEAGVIKKK